MKNLQESDPIADLLASCEERRCQRFAQVCCDPGIPDKRLEYEDVFYPARCHQDQDVCLIIETGAGAWALQYGAGDFFYEVRETEHTYANAIDPTPIYEAVQEGRARVRPRYKDQIDTEVPGHD